MSPDTIVQDQPEGRAKSSAMSRYAQEVVRQGIFRLPTNPRGDGDEPPKSLAGPGSPSSKDEYDYNLDGASSPNRRGYAGAAIAGLHANATQTFPTSSDDRPMREQIKAEVRAFMLEKDMKEEADMRAHVFELAMPELQWVATEAAKREVGRLIAEKRTKVETEDEKIAAVASRLQELPSRSLVTLFRKREVVDLLKRVLDRLDRKVDDEGWEVLNAQ